MPANGEHGDSVFAFARHYRRSWLVAIVPRLTTRITNAQNMPLGETVWADTTVALPAKSPSEWHNIFTGATFEMDATKSPAFPVSWALGSFPVALLSGRF